ncbi:hypothetical protein [Serratia marcescens]|uniref:hypothetical protein n=1 Tax=Serratia marcescens TaxID=615 RepID=UPI00320A5065
MNNDHKVWLITRASSGLELVTLTAPPVRLMLGRDAYAMWAMWDTTLAKRQQELNAWRERGENTAFDGAELTEI